MSPLPIESDRGVAAPGRCQRRDLDDWTTTGGPLPASLAEHITQCQSCAEQVRRIGRVGAALTLIRTQPMRADLIEHANRHGLQLLRRAARASAEAERMLRTKPDLAWWQRAHLHVSRASTGLAAAVLLVVVRAGLLGGWEQTRIMGESLAHRHRMEHIDPGGEWLELDRNPAERGAGV